MNKQDRQWAVEVSGKIKKKMEVVADRSRHKIPYRTYDGVFDDLSESNVCWWTNGFWGGMMWQLYHATKNPMYREIAEENERKLDANLMNYQGMDHDSGFKWLLTSVANYKETGSKESYNRARLAADNMAGRFNPAGRFIRAWNDWSKVSSNAGKAIIDCMMNLPLLYWAFEETGDHRYKHIATMHADTAMKYFIREDGSANHVVEFDTATGEFVKVHGGQGYCEGSSWTRGQAWAIYGFIFSYKHTGEKKYLECAKKVADYFIKNIPESGLVPVDFCQPSEPAWEDSTAAAIAACGMIQIAEEDEACKYLDTALKLLKVLDEKRCNWSLDTDNLLEKCTAAYHDKEHEFTIIYGDYYFIEAIWKLTGEELYMW